MKVVHWKTTISKKALDAGISTGGPVVLYHKSFVEVTGLTTQDEVTTMAEYDWQWAPTDIGRKLGVTDRGRTTERALFRRYDDGWRLMGASSEAPGS